MKASDYAQEPWKEANCHASYSKSVLHMRPAPEYACGEVVLASLYRNVGFSDKVTEGKVPALGRQLLKQLEKCKAPAISVPLLQVDAWRNILQGALKTPKQPNQTAKRFLQICPTVPDAAIYSMSARLAANSWNPGNLVGRALSFGCRSHLQAKTAWENIFAALSVTAEDDIWAQFINSEFMAWRPSELTGEWNSVQPLPLYDTIETWRNDAPTVPANQFSEDLARIIALKPFLTRRQWISMFESILRFGTASHVLWICHANATCLKMMEDVLDGTTPPSCDQLRSLLSVPTPYLRYGQLATKTIKDAAKSFIVGRACINLLLFNCDDMVSVKGVSGVMPLHPLSSISNLSAFLSYLAVNRAHFPRAAFQNQIHVAMESDPGVEACKRGIGSNIVEFLGHVLRQRQTSEQGLDSYDQGYYLRKRGGMPRAPWVVGLGPVAALTLVHCCTRTSRGPRTILDLCSHLARYGLEVTAQDIDETELGMTLRNLGLVLDSPDAEGGMVLVSPFTQFLAKESL